MKHSAAPGLGLGMQRVTTTFRSTASESVSGQARQDWVVVEEPLEIRLAGEPFAVTMRTPGQDHELVAGFLLAEGIIATRGDLGSIAPCGRPDEEGYGNVVDVLPAPGTLFAEQPAELVRRGTMISAACGVCGRRTIADLLARCRPLSDELGIEARRICELPAALRAEQQNFARTGGLHAAGIFSSEGELIAAREDVGRHNAVDKVLGRLLLDGELPAGGRLLLVSGRTSFEMVQKALVARVPILVGVSAPSSLAVETARQANLTLVGFARDGSFNVYAGAERVF